MFNHLWEAAFDNPNNLGFHGSSLESASLRFAYMALEGSASPQVPHGDPLRY